MLFQSTNNLRVSDNLIAKSEAVRKQLAEATLETFK